MWITCAKGAAALYWQGLRDTGYFLTSASMGSAAVECASFPQPAAHHARSDPRIPSPRCRHRWRPRRPDGCRSTGQGRPGGRGLRCHAFSGPQVPAGGCRRHEHHPFRALPGVRGTLCRTPGRNRGPATRLRCGRVAPVDSWFGHRNLRRHLGPGVSHRHESRTVAACLAQAPARQRGSYPHPPSLVGLEHRWQLANCLSTGRTAGESLGRGAGAGWRQLGALGF